MNRNFKILSLIALMVFSGLGLSAKKKKKGKGGGISSVPSEINGAGNNQDHPQWGMAHTPLKRVTTYAYNDNNSSLTARVVSNAVMAESTVKINDRNLTDMLWQWGQFLDHDMSLTEAAEPKEPWPIGVPMGDEQFDPNFTGTQEISFNRSEYEIDPVTGYRLQLNRVTSFIDASQVYGSDTERADALRTFSDGELKTSDNELLPFNEEGLENAGSREPNLFLAGDVRANEQVGLISMHTLFVREHNRYVNDLKRKNRKLSDEELYQTGRAYVRALVQVITFKEFLPALLGEDAIQPYQGYSSEISPGIMNVFSTAAFRFGHSAVSPILFRLDDDGNEIPAGNLNLKDSFFRPDNVKEYDDIGYVMKGLSSQKMRELDTEIIDDLRNLLFGKPGEGGMDLAALNIQRGRDHWLAPYCQIRRDFDLPCNLDYSDMTSDTVLVNKFKSIYNDVESVDLWAGMMAEDHLPGSSAGELMTKIFVTQFENLRRGDSFWYENLYSGKTLRNLEKTKLSDVIKRNTQIKNIQANVFFK